MGDEINENGEVYNRYLELSKPTKQDFERVFTDEELKELCLKHKCRVDMWRWNVANDYRILFTESGRYQRWSKRDRLRMLTKAVNRMKPSILYNEDEIKKTRKEEWGLQLKENILSLNFWKRKRLQTYHSPTQVLTESNDMDESVQSQYEVNTESMNAEELLTQTHGQELALDNNNSTRKLEVSPQFEVHTESTNTNKLMTKAQDQELQKEISKLQELPSQYDDNAGFMYEEDEEVSILRVSEEECLIDEDEQDSLDTVVYNELKVHLEREALNSEEVDSKIENIYDINTMSMTINSEMCTQSQDLPIPQSQDVIPQNYDYFKDIVPLTSTQSQSYESEKV